MAIKISLQNCPTSLAIYLIENNPKAKAKLEKMLKGVLKFWTFPGATNARTRGFNNKIRWLVKQAYGYRDYRYFHLKVFDLPNLGAVNQLVNGFSMRDAPLKTRSGRFQAAVFRI